MTPILRSSSVLLRNNKVARALGIIFFSLLATYFSRSTAHAAPTTVSGTISNIPANAYVQFMRKNGIKKDKYDFASGIQEREMHFFVSWLQSYHGKRAAFFDWDRTITMVSGLFLPEITINGEFVEDLLVYALGGFQRLAALRDLFQLCFLNNVTIVILSNSTVCNYANFNAILHQLIRGPFIKLCANGQNKGNVLAKNARFYNLCKTIK